MSDPVDLFAHRSRQAEAQALAEVEAELLLSQPRGPEYLNYVKEGVERAARLMRAVPYIVREAAEGYEMREGFGRTPVALAGPKGMDDFRESFICVGFSIPDPEIERASGIAYGVYGSVKLSLPRVSTYTPGRQRVLNRHVTAYQKATPEVSDDEAVDEVFGWVAGQLALYVVQGLVHRDFKDELQTVANNFGLPLEDQTIGDHFTGRMPQQDALRIVGR